MTLAIITTQLGKMGQNADMKQTVFATNNSYLRNCYTLIPSLVYLRRGAAESHNTIIANSGNNFNTSGAKAPYALVVFNGSTRAFQA